jgi:hypothetical protein
MEMRILAGTRIFGMRTECLIALVIIDGIYRDAGYKLVVTCGMNGTHSRGSLHYAGAAFDIRTGNIPQEKRQGVADEIRKNLGDDFDVVLETTHCHIEWQPKQPYK